MFIELNTDVRRIMESEPLLSIHGKRLSSCEKKKLLGRVFLYLNLNPKFESEIGIFETAFGKFV